MITFHACPEWHCTHWQGIVPTSGHDFGVVGAGPVFGALGCVRSFQPLDLDLLKRDPSHGVGTEVNAVFISQWFTMGVVHHKPRSGLFSSTVSHVHTLVQVQDQVQAKRGSAHGSDSLAAEAVVLVFCRVEGEAVAVSGGGNQEKVALVQT